MKFLPLTRSSYFIFLFFWPFSCCRLAPPLNCDDGTNGSDRMPFEFPVWNDENKMADTHTHQKTMKNERRKWEEERKTSLFLSLLGHQITPEKNFFVPFQYWLFFSLSASLLTLLALLVRFPSFVRWFPFFLSLSPFLVRKGWLYKSHPIVFVGSALLLEIPSWWGSAVGVDRYS